MFARMLQPVVDGLSFVLKDTRALLQHIEFNPLLHHLPPHCVLITIDVESLYPSMDIDVTCAHVRTALNHHYQHRATLSFIDAIINLLHFILNTSYVQFMDSTYHQVSGIPMGLSCATQLANIYVYHCIANVLREWTHTRHIRVAYGYIDDLVVIWTGAVSDIPAFIAALNAIHPGRLRFTYNFNTDSINFLDIVIYKGPRFTTTGQLDTAPYVKALNNFQYIPATSAHPPRCLSSFIYAEGLRLVRNSSQPHTAIAATALFVRHLRARGYKPRTIKRALAKVSITDRHRLLQPSPPRPQVSALVLPYNAWTASLGVPALLRSTVTCLPARPLVAWSRGVTLHKALRLQWPRPVPPPTATHSSTSAQGTITTPDNTEE
jgi:hypothetical protein